jgi:hypothetical protein
MQTNDERPITFGHIKSGEVFLYDGDIFLKLHDEASIYDEDTEDTNIYNVVDLTDGALYCIDVDERVQRFVVAPELIYDSDKTIAFFPKN